jgi:hypothetical protein
VKNVWPFNGQFSECSIIRRNNGWVNELEVERSQEKQRKEMVAHQGQSGWEKRKKKNTIRDLFRA